MGWLKRFARADRVEAELATLRDELTAAREEAARALGQAIDRLGEEQADTRRRVEAAEVGLAECREWAEMLDRTVETLRAGLEAKDPNRLRDELRRELGELRGAVARAEARVRVAVADGDRTAAALMERMAARG